MLMSHHHTTNKYRLSILLLFVFTLLESKRVSADSSESHQSEQEKSKLCRFVDKQFEKEEKHHHRNHHRGHINKKHGNASADLHSVMEVIRLASARLDLAQQVALYKWQHNQSIDDPIREAALLASVAVQANASGLAVDFAQQFFQDQINASKIIQFAYFASWQENGAPNVTAPDLSTVTRPLINNVTSELVQALVPIQTIRQQHKCQIEVAIGLKQLIRNQQINTNPEANRAKALCVALTHVCANNESGN